MGAAVESQLQASAVEIDRPGLGAPVRVSVLLEGNPAGVPERVTGMRELLGGGAAAAGQPPAWWGRGAAAAGDGTLIRIAFWSGGLRDVLDGLDAVAAAAGVDPAIGGSPGAGVLYAAVDGLAEAEAVARFVAMLRADVERAPGAGFPRLAAAWSCSTPRRRSAPRSTCGARSRARR